MKIMKRIVSTVLLAVLLMSLSVTVFASGAIKTTGDVYLRSKPGLNYKALTVVPEGTTLEALGSAYDDRNVEWIKVKYSKQTGWISSVYCKDNQQKKDPKNKCVASDGSSYIRSKPNKTAAQLGILPEGKVATYLRQHKTDSRGVEWYKVTYKGITGWVSSKYTTIR